MHSLYSSSNLEDIPCDKVHTTFLILSYVAVLYATALIQFKIYYISTNNCHMRDRR